MDKNNKPQILKSEENSNRSDVVSIGDRLDKIERIKQQYGSESNQYIIIALNEITEILREQYLNNRT